MQASMARPLEIEPLASLGARRSALGLRPLADPSRQTPAEAAPVHFGWLYALSLIACLSHPALDWLNNYGVRLLEPFSSRWFNGDVLFIINLWLWLGLGFAAWLSLRREKKTGCDWRTPARIALAASLAYIGLNAAITWQAEQRTRA